MYTYFFWVLDYVLFSVSINLHFELSADIMLNAISSSSFSMCVCVFVCVLLIEAHVEIFEESEIICCKVKCLVPQIKLNLRLCDIR